MALNIISNVQLDMKAPNTVIVYANQYDSAGSVRAQLLNSGESWAVPAGAKAVVMFKKSDNIGGFYDVTEFGVAAVEIDSDRSVIYINYDPQVLTTAGRVAVQINFYQNDQRLSSFAFYTDVQASAVTSGEIASSWLFNILSQEIAQTLTVATTPQAMTDWLEANITQETGYVIDNTLTVAGAASDAQATGKMVTVSNTNPNTVANKVWVKKTPAEIQIPTCEEVDELNSALSNIKSNVYDIEPNSYRYDGLARNNSGTIQLTGNGSWRCTFCNVIPGRGYKILTNAYGSNFYAVTFTDANGRIIDERFKPGVSSIVVVNDVLIAPPLSVMMYVNSRSGDTYPTILEAIYVSDFSENIINRKSIITFTTQPGIYKNDNGTILPVNNGSYERTKIPCHAGCVYRVTLNTYNTLTNHLNRYIYVTDFDGTILEPFCQYSADGSVTTNVFVSDPEARYIYVNSYGSGNISILEIEMPFMRLDAEKELLTFKAKHGGLTNVGGSINIVSASTKLDYDVFTVGLNDRYAITVDQVESSNFPYYGFIADEDGVILQSILPYGGSAGTVSCELFVTQKNAKYLYITTAKELTNASVVKSVPFWTKEIKELQNAVKNDFSSVLDGARYKIFELNEDDVCMNFTFVTDTHFNGGLDGAIVSAENNLKAYSLMSNEKWADFAMHGGDVYSAYDMTDEDVAALLDETALKVGGIAIPFYWVKGNHELNLKTGAGNFFSNSQFFLAAQNRLIGSVTVNPEDPYGGYFYRDCKGVRVIALNTWINSTETEQSGMSEAEDIWLENVLDDALEHSLPVIIFMHNPILSTGNRVYVLLHAFQTGGGRVIALIHGHTHTDDYDDIYGFNMIGVRRGFAYLNEFETTAEFCFSVFTVNLSTGKLYETRIGSGTDRSFDF